MAVPAWAKPLQTEPSIPAWATPLSGDEQPDPPQVQEVEQPGFIQRVGEDWSRRGEEIGQMVERETAGGTLETIGKLPQIGALAAGKAIGGIGDVAAEGAVGAYKTLVPEKAQETIASGLQSIADTDIGRKGLRAMEAGTKAWGRYKGAYPDSAMALEGIANVFGATQVLKGVGAVGREGAAITGDIARGTVKKGFPAELYRSGAKFSTTMDKKTVAKATNTLLENKIPLSEAGYQNLDDLISGLNTKIQKAIAPVSDVKVDPTQARKWVSGAISKANNTFDKTKNLKKIQTTVNRFIADHPDLTIGTAQKIKQDIYKKLKKHYTSMARTGTQLYSDGEIAALKNIAVGLKNEVANKAKGVAGFNAQESALLTAEPLLRRATNRIANHNIFSLDDVMATAAATAVAGKPAGVVVGALKKFVGAPEAKSKVAIWLDEITKTPGKSKTIRAVKNVNQLRAINKTVAKIEEFGKKLISKEKAAEIVAEVRESVPPGTFEVFGAGKSAKQSASVFEELFRMAQSPQGKKALVQKLSQDAKHAALLDEILKIPTQKALPGGGQFQLVSKAESENALSRAIVANRLGSKSIPSTSVGGVGRHERQLINAMRRGLSPRNR